MGCFFFCFCLIMYFTFQFEIADLSFLFSHLFLVNIKCTVTCIRCKEKKTFSSLKRGFFFFFLKHDTEVSCSDWSVSPSLKQPMSIIGIGDSVGRPWISAATRQPREMWGQSSVFIFFCFVIFFICFVGFFCRNFRPGNQTSLTAKTVLAVGVNGVQCFL